MSNDILPPILFPATDGEIFGELLEPLELFSHDDLEEAPYLEIFTTHAAESLLFAGTQGLLPLTAKVAFWSGPSPAEGIKKVDDTLVYQMAHGKLALSYIDGYFIEAERGIVATPRAKRIPLPLGDSKCTAQAGDRASLRNCGTTGSPRARSGFVTWPRIPESTRL